LDRFAIAKKQKSSNACAAMQSSKRNIRWEMSACRVGQIADFVLGRETDAYPLDRHARMRHVPWPTADDAALEEQRSVSMGA
jgi:hypothetical protein